MKNHIRVIQDKLDFAFASNFTIMTSHGKLKWEEKEMSTALGYGVHQYYLARRLFLDVVIMVHMDNLEIYMGVIWLIKAIKWW